ncbi:MAG: nitrophenyl compound nitroreductase subunit ArsF family protein [Bacteroidales bacterium]|nr:nitrophenyl compound nitroreductase subunit ArsF family protein [Bacteroidales bacterium]MCF8343854.1 nitrophenyl compound nitroreductase subunit ArsF family protein [Bacteroidales bacterium]MCF8349578.1 nitrophenyl compound nitroreductase subunit ArsF family protein [Bacteroidales bacterium]MCF8375137.1 nitrophenyl compound nitroreductase subunit ArsF family protein [Bacteroidales bacterium]MCF8400044.1 nitrophenyl compound nitroreductase subunit ArsF family protein [Bacteroidales bacterium
MKTVKIISLLFVLAGMNFSCAGQSDQNQNTRVKKADDVQVYYFHNERRCATCKAVESESKEAVEELYGDKVTFYAYNLEETEGEQKAEELGVSGQTLLIVGGDTRVDLTNEAFMNARNNPEKLKQILKEKIDPMIN